MQSWNEYNWEHILPDRTDDSIAHVEFLVCGQIPTCPSIDNPTPGGHVKDLFSDMDFSFTVNGSEAEDSNQRASKCNPDVELQPGDGDKDSLDHFVKEIEYKEEHDVTDHSDAATIGAHDDAVECTSRKRSPSRIIEARRAFSKRQRADANLSDATTNSPCSGNEISSPPLSAISIHYDSPIEPLMKSKRLHTKRQRTPPLIKPKSLKIEASEESFAAQEPGSRTLLRECKFVSKRSGCPCMHIPLITKHKRGYLSVVCGSGHQWVWCRQCCNCSTANDDEDGERGGCNLKTHWFERDAFDTGRRNHMRNAHGQSLAFET